MLKYTLIVEAILETIRKFTTLIKIKATNFKLHLIEKRERRLDSEIDQFLEEAGIEYSQDMQETIGCAVSVLNAKEVYDWEERKR